MRKIKAESTEPQAIPAAESTSPKTKDSGRNWRPVILVAAILFLAAFVRVAFSFGVSAGSEFALSGGTEASNNLRFVESIVNDGKIRFTDNYLNYPNTSLIVVPIFFDLVMAAFGMLFHLFISNGTEASSLALALSGPVFGVLACIPMYFVGREMFSSKVAGYMSALFLALCPVFVQESVFSNGVGTSFALFFFLIGVYFLVKALKASKEFGADIKTPLIAGVFIAISMLSWLDIRYVAIPFVIVMIAQVLVDRFKGKDPRAAASIYLEVLVVGFAAPCIVYSVAGYWDALVSGTVCFLVLAAVFTALFAWTSKKPWILTLPVCAGICLVAMLALAIAAPHLYGCMIGGNSVYDPVYLDSLGRQYLSLSQLASYYGYVTYWFVFLVCLYMAYRFLKNASSALYTFTLVWLFTMTLTLGHNSAQAAFAAPVFALGFGAVCKTVLAHVDFKAYFSGIKTGAGSKTKIRRIISPIPLISILVAVFLVAAPNMMQVVDAGISTNDASDYNDKINDVTGSNQFGALGYYVKTDDSWKVRAALSDGNVAGKGGAFVTWLSYSDDVKIYADSKCFTDTYGNGSAAASNILLADAVDGSSSAALLLTAIMSKGMTDDVKTKLASSGFNSSDIEIIEKVIDDADYTLPGYDKSVREMVISDYKTYGTVSADLSDENVIYLFLTDYIAAKYHNYDITLAYDALGLRSPYIMVTGDMMPFFYGYAGTFDEMALLNGYQVDRSNGTVSKYTTFGYHAYYYGVYDFTDAMYDTLLYRTYVGMTPSEAGYDSIYSYLSALSAADATVQMHPGYGLSNYKVAYWQVMYNPNSNATPSSDGWKQMDAIEAIELQKVDGGLINYVSGLPVILEYVPNSAGHLVSGVVTDGSSVGVSGVRVSAVDSAGVVHATTHTSSDGSFKLFVDDPATTTLTYFLGSDMASTGGVLVGTNPATSPNLSGVVTMTDVEINLVQGTNHIDVVDAGKMKYTLSFKNVANGDSWSFAAGTAHAATFAVGVGNYTVTVTDGDKELATATLSITAGMDKVDLVLKSYTYKVTVKDQYGAVLPSTSVTLKGMVNLSATTDSDGLATFDNVPAGTYTLGVAGKFVDSPTVSINSNSSKDLTVQTGADCTITVPVAGLTVYIVGDAYSTSQVSSGTTMTVTLPKSSISATKFVAYAFYNGQIWSAVLDTSSSSCTLAAGDLSVVSGVVKNSEGTAVSSTVVFVNGAAKYTFKTSADGAYKALVPAGTYDVYATDSTDAYFGKMTVAAGNVSDRDINMVDADRVSTTSLYWSSVYYSYAMVEATVTSGSDTYVMPIMSSNGAFEFFLPRGMSASVNFTPASSVFNTVTKTVDASHESAQNLSFSLTSTSTSIHVTNDLAVPGTTELKIGGITHTVSDWALTEAFSVNSNSMQIVLGSATDSVYFTGYHYFNPEVTTTSVNLSELLNGATLADITADRFTIPDYSSDYSVKVYYDLAENKYVNITSSDPVRIDKPTFAGYFLLITSADKTKILFENYASGSDHTVNISSCGDAVSIEGYIGSNVSTSMTFIETASPTLAREVTVTDGNYSVILKKNASYNILLEKTVKGVKYHCDVNGKVFADSGKYNINGLCEPESISITPVITMHGTTAEVSFTIPAGAVANTTDNADKFSFNVGAGWESYTFSTGTSICDGVYVPDHGSNADVVTFHGYYNSSLYRLGTSDLAISVSGSSDKYAVSFNGIGGTDGLIFVNKSTDVVGDHSYEYVYTIVNMGSNEVTIQTDLSGTPAHLGWYLYYKVTDSRGTYITEHVTDVDVMPGTTTISVVLMSEVDSTDAVPDVHVVFTAPNGIVTTTADEISISGGVATSDAHAEVAEVSVSDMSANGRGVINDKGSVPTIVWVMAAFIALLLILIFWMSSKRGVFARRK